MSGIPRVVILGYPNAGKSTLFNRLLGRRTALVHSLSGMTRDSLAGVREMDGRRVEIVDTGGFFDDRAEPLSAKVKAKAWEAAGSADVLILLLDGRTGLLPAEEDLHRALRKLDKPLLVAINKVDTEAQKPDLGDYYRLGEERLLFVSAEHRRGFDELEEAILAALPPRRPEEDAPGPEALRIAVIGRTNVGKSSLANRLSGEERFIVSEVPGTTRDTTDILIRRDGKAYRLIDTAGIRKPGKIADERESAGVIKARKNIPLADVLVLVMDAAEFPTRQDTAVARLAADSGKPLVLALNKWDLAPPEADPGMAEEIVFRRLEFVSYAPLVAVSALTGRRIAQILTLAEKVHAAGLRRIATPVLNKFLETAQAAHPPVSPSGRRFRIRYMTQTGVLPPTFACFAGTATAFAPAYERALAARLREAFDLHGTPVRFVLRPSRRARPG